MAKAKGNKTTEDLEREADVTRKAKVDATNTKNAAADAKAQDELSNTPLDDEEREFVVSVRSKMNIGRNGSKPPAADILRYSKLLKRENVK